MKTNTQKKLFLGLIFGLILVISVNFAFFEIKAIAQKTTPTPTTTQPKRQRSTWEAILSLFKAKKEPSSGSRGFVCLVSPGLLEETNVIWSNQPLFLWQGDSPQFEIRLYAPFDPEQEQQILWSETITAQSVQYTGEPLQPGKTYDWELIDRSDKHQLRRSFQVMELEKREQITADLNNIETQMRAEGASIEEIALEQADYFAKKNLWSDALQKMYSVHSPSSELTSKKQEILSYLCLTELPTVLDFLQKYTFASS